MTPAQITEEQREALEALARARDTAMHQTLAADIPACGAFGAIAQDLDFALPIISAAEARGYARGVEDAAKRCDAAAEAMAALLARHPDSLVALYSGDMARDLADGLRALSPSPAQKED